MRELEFETGVLRRLSALPVPLALHSEEKWTGRGVTMAVLDSAFLDHPDLTMPENRIVAYYDASGEDYPLEGPATGSHWHGTMTSVVAGGNGFLSGGFFRSLAPEVRLVLIKVSGGSDGIDEATVVRGLNWLLENHQRLGVRLLTTSIQANDESISAWEDEVDLALRRVWEAGITVVCAAGNDGRMSTPPGNSPWAITVGGVSLEGRRLIPYDPSCYGETADGMMKPEVVALASQLAGVLLPGTPDSTQALALCRLRDASADTFRELVLELAEAAGLEEAQLGLPDEQLLWFVESRFRDLNLINGHYKTVDGTSFSAPIVASLVAQMLQANSALQPAQIRQILCQTADTIDGLDRERQGFGLINPGRSLQRALGQPAFKPSPQWFVAPHREEGRVVFRHFRPMAEQVSLAGSFNQWHPQPMQRDRRGLWALTLALADGLHTYKFVIDGEWREDPNNLLLTPDGLGGMNSLIDLH